jgi:hypothetical protein
MASTAASSATGIQVISVQDLYYNNKMYSSSSLPPLLLLKTEADLLHFDIDPF